MKQLTRSDSREVISHCKSEITSARTRFIRQRLMLTGLRHTMASKADKTADDLKVLNAIDNVVAKLDEILDAMVVV